MFLFNILTYCMVIATLELASTSTTSYNYSSILRLFKKKYSHYITVNFLFQIALGTSGEEPACCYRRHKTYEFGPWIRKIPWKRVWQPTRVFLPGESHEQRRLVGYSP